MRSRTLFVFAFVLASMISTIPVLHAQSGTGTVEGILVEDGKPNQNAKVSVMWYSDGPTENIVYSNAQGYFTVSGIPVGKSVSVVVYDGEGRAVGTGSASIRYTGEKVLVEITPVPIVRQP